MNEKERFPIDLGLNEREQKRFVELFRRFGSQANDLANAIEINDNREILAEFMIFSMILSQLSEFKTIVTETLTKKGKENDDFPEFIKNL